jgi:Uma2 family endonuclease
MPTTEELLELYEVEDAADLDPIPDGYELIDGELVETPDMSVESGWVIGKLFRLLDDWCERTKTGVALTGEVGYRCFPARPGRVRKPDVSVLLANPDTFVPGRGDSRDVPALVVEVVSPNETVYDLDARVHQFLGAGTRLVWVVNPVLRTVLVRRADGTVQLLTDPAELTGESVLPGFATPLAAFLPPVPATPPT